MRKLFACLVLAAVFALPLVAQQSNDAPDLKPPAKIIQIIREHVKPGKDPVHEKNEALYTAAFRKANFPYYAVALTAMTGKHDAWFIVPIQKYSDFAAADKLVAQDTALKSELDRLGNIESDLLNDTDNIIAVFEKDLSYRPEFNLGEQRLTMVDVIRVKPGHVEEWKELRKASNAAHEKLNMDEHMLVYSARFGAQGGTYYVFQPMTSIEAMDKIDELHGDAYKQALGEEFDKKMKDFALNGAAYFERNLFGINPGMSYVSQQVIATAPDFWQPKTQTMVNAKTKKPAPKADTQKKSGMAN